MRINIPWPLPRAIFWRPWKGVFPSPPAPPMMEPNTRALAAKSDPNSPFLFEHQQV
jgi:hypothetical protein